MIRACLPAESRQTAYMLDGEYGDAEKAEPEAEFEPEVGKEMWF